MNQEQTMEDILNIVNFIKDNASTKDDLDRLATKDDIQRIESTMVTKDYLDEKLADLRGDLNVLMRKEDNKLKTLIEILFKKGTTNNEEKTQILSLEPFAQLQ